MKNLENIEFLLDDLSAIVKKDAPHLLRLFEVFAQEARFGREWLATALMKLDANAKILEVGAGLMLLSSQLVKEGYEVVALEPIGDGFSQFAELQKIVLGYASMQKVLPTIKSIPIEHLTETNCYDFAFSINVMEHIESVELSICNISNALKPAASYQFTCPNYTFPYEPHFNIPTAFSKELTELIFREKILNSHRVSDPKGMWKSLNWINVFQLKRIIGKKTNISASFDKTMLSSMFVRVVQDKEFALRRSWWVRELIKAMVMIRMHKITTLVPATLQPIINCTITKK